MFPESLFQIKIIQSPNGHKFRKGSLLVDVPVENKLSFHGNTNPLKHPVTGHCQVAVLANAENFLFTGKD